MGERILENSMAENGYEVVLNTVERVAASDSGFVGIIVLEDAVISAITCDPPLTGGAITGITLNAGMALPIKFKKITLTSGKVMLAKGV